ncbi:MAG: hypothetical protein QNJ16_15615 [Rhodobacter sp.]|nr:hypothetical protein [Rhodobacter sp.]
MADPKSPEILQQIGAFEAKLENLEKTLERAVIKSEETAEKSDAAIEANQAEISGLKSSVKGLQLPIWKRPTVVGGFLAVIVLAGVWLVSAFGETRPLQKTLHGDILFTDTAIGQMLGDARALENDGESYKSELYDQIKSIIAFSLKEEKETQEALARSLETSGRPKGVIIDTARKLGTKTYNAAKVFFPHELQSTGLSCLLSQDADFIDALLSIASGPPGGPAGGAPGGSSGGIFGVALGDEVGPPTPRDARAQARQRLAERMCKKGSEDEARVTIPYVDLVPLQIPFTTNKNDTMTLILSVSATPQQNPDQELKTPLDAVRVSLDADPEALTMDRAPDGKSSTYNMTFEADKYEDGQKHVLSIQLTDKGYDMVGLTGAEQIAEGDDIDILVPETYAVAVLATLIINAADNGGASQ